LVLRRGVAILLASEISCGSGAGDKSHIALDAGFQMLPDPAICAACIENYYIRRG